MKLLQQGTGPNVLAMVFCGTAVGKAVSTLGPSVSVYAVPGSRLSESERQKLVEVRANADKAGGELCLAGYSAGAGAVRSALDLVDPHICIMADGGAISLPGQPQTMPRSQYERFIELAKRGERRFIASHTYLEYTERIKDDPRTPQVENPYRSTVGTLRDITGLELLEPSFGESAVTTLGGITVLSYESGPADRAAHAKQVQEVLPLMIETYLRPRFHSVPSAAIGLGLVEGMGALAANIGAAVVRAAEQAASVFAAPKAEHYESHGWRCSCAELVADSRKRGRWHDVGAMGSYVPKVGDLVISSRAGGDPRRGGSGHVERITRTGPIHTIGGNESNTWVEAPLSMNQVVGFIDVDAEIGRLAVALSRAELRAGVAEIAGPAAHPRIQAYHAGARRGGSDLAGMLGREAEGLAVLGPRASDEIHWCASAASWATYCASLECLA